MQALILCGGLGTRLKTVSGDLPKPLVAIAGRPVIEHQLDCLVRSGVADAVFIAGYRADLIEAHLKLHPRHGLRTRVFTETEPLGSAGAICARLGEFEAEFFVIYGDTVFDVDLAHLREFHLAHRSEGTLLLHPNDHPEDSDLVDTDTDGLIRGFLGYPHPPGLNYRNQVNAGIYFLEARVLKRVIAKLPAKIDFAKQVFPALLSEGAHLFGYPSREYIKDMGTPGRFQHVESDLVSGKVAARARRNLIPALFFDRDGTLTRSLDYVRTPEQLEMLPGASEAIQATNKAGYLAILTTNQPVVARGECSLEGLDQIHRKLETELGRAHAYLDAIYFCPHHPDKGFPGEVAELKVRCDCRKPAPGMLLQAQREQGADFARSWLIGDTTADTQCARAAGVKSALVRTGYAGRDGKVPVLPDFEFDHAREAVRFITTDYEPLRERVSTWLKENPLQPGQVLTVAGPARSGKSSLSAILRDVLRSQGQTCEIIPLDGWLLPLAKRLPGFQGRYDLAGLEAFLANSFAQRPERIEIPVYDRETRGPFAWKATLPLGPKTITIFEGVTAGLSPWLAKTASRKIWADAPRESRLARFLEHYRVRGKEDAFSAALFAEREIEEVAELKALAQDSGATDWIWTGEGFQRQQ